MTKLVHGLCYLLLTNYVVCLLFMAFQLAFFNAHDGGNLPPGAPAGLYELKSWLCAVCSTSVFVVALVLSVALWQVSQRRPLNKALLLGTLCFYPVYYFVGVYICW
jgi:hypothetical protein